MMKITIDVDCDNAPKKQYVKDFVLAFAEADIDKIIDMMSDEATWLIIGEAKHAGKQNIRKVLEVMKPSIATEIIVHNILSHGKLCSANGELVYADSKIAFSDVYEFENHGKDAKIKNFTSYATAITESNSNN